MKSLRIVHNETKEEFTVQYSQRLCRFVYYRVDNGMLSGSTLGMAIRVLYTLPDGHPITEGMLLALMKEEPPIFLCTLEDL